MSENRNGFTSKLGVILATVGTAVGLGNIWRFPFILGNNGGGAFLLIYFFCLVLLGLPVVLAEFTVGRRAQANAVDAYKKFTNNPIWSKIGYLGVFAGFLIMGYYSVVLGWTAEYLFQAIVGNLQGHSPEAYQQMFADLSGGTVYPILLVVAVMAVTCFIISRGVQSGIEGVSRYLMPLLFILMLGLVGYSLTLDGAAEGLKFLFYPDFSEVKPQTILDAMGQCFFSLSLGMGCLTTYASYFKKDVNLPNTAVQIISIDTLVAVLAGLMIFPAVFSFGLEPSQGAGLVYVVLPNVFQQMVGGQIFAIMFYALLFIAALTSMISLLEVVTAYVHETFKLNRTASAVIITVLVIIMAVFASLSCGAMPELALFGKSIFDIFDYISAVILLPLGGMAISIYAGWIIDEKILYVEFARNNKYAMWLFKAYAFALRYIAPVCIFVVFVSSFI